jgi:toxin ParE1/3/4
MSRAVFSPRAQTDIGEISDFTADRWNIDQADENLRQLRAAVEPLAEAPYLGASCDDIRAGYRKFPVGSHVVFYRHRADVIIVVRILHRRMDAARQRGRR